MCAQTSKRTFCTLCDTTFFLTLFIFSCFRSAESSNPSEYNGGLTILSPSSIEGRYLSGPYYYSNVNAENFNVTGEMVAANPINFCFESSLQNVDQYKGKIVLVSGKICEKLVDFGRGWMSSL